MDPVAFDIRPVSTDDDLRTVVAVMSLLPAPPL